MQDELPNPGVNCVLEKIEATSLKQPRLGEEAISENLQDFAVLVPVPTAVAAAPEAPVHSKSFHDFSVLFQFI